MKKGGNNMSENKVDIINKALKVFGNQIGDKLKEIHEAISGINDRIDKIDENQKESLISKDDMTEIYDNFDLLLTSFESNSMIYTPLSESCRFVLTLDNLTSGKNPKTLEQMFDVLNEQFGIVGCFIYLNAIKRPLDHKIVRPNLLEAVKTLLKKFTKEYNKSIKKREKEKNNE